MNAIAIVAVRKGSKDISKKWATPVCGRSLLDWTMFALSASPAIDRTVVVSDDVEALEHVSNRFTCDTVVEPDQMATDCSRVDDVWVYALDAYEKANERTNIVVTAQVTSPLRKPDDITNAVIEFMNGNYDSMMSVVPARDLCLWKPIEDGVLEPVTHECIAPNRRRQDFEKRVIENGSFYLFKPWALRYPQRRLAGRVGIYEMQPWQLAEVDELSDAVVCSALMSAYLKGNLQ